MPRGDRNGYGVKNKQTNRVRALVGRGFSNKEISVALKLHFRTVIFHIEKLYKESGLYAGCDARRLVIFAMTGKVPK